jgi:hypothetical protein
MEAGIRGILRDGVAERGGMLIGTSARWRSLGVN